MPERWLPVEDYEGLYEISDLGHVRSLQRWARGRLIHERLLAPVLDSTGYPTVRLSKAGSTKRFKVHRLVCAAFHGAPQPGQQAAHLDGDRANPRAANLTWATQSENEEHKRAHGTKMLGEGHVQARLRATDVVEIRQRVASGETQTTVRADYGISSGHISEIVTGKKWSEADSGIAQRRSHDHP